MSSLTPRERARRHAAYAMRSNDNAADEIPAYVAHDRIVDAWMSGYRAAARNRRKVPKRERIGKLLTRYAPENDS